MSLEKEVFPFMAQDGDLFAFNLEGELWGRGWMRGVRVCVGGGGGGSLELHVNNILRYNCSDEGDKKEWKDKLPSRASNLDPETANPVH